jgi:hypothetical protein
MREASQKITGGTINQYGGGACSLCGSAGTNKSTCPLNPNAANKVAAKHPLAKVPSPVNEPVNLPANLPLNLPLTSGRPLPPSLIKGAVKLKVPAKKTVTAPVTVKVKVKVKRTVKAKAVIAKIFNHFYPIWATYHRDRGQDYKGLFIGTKTSAEARGFVDFIYDTCHDDPETIRFWVGATQKDILDELYDNQGAYFRNFSLKLN